MDSRRSCEYRDIDCIFYYNKLINCPLQTSDSLQAIMNLRLTEPDDQVYEILPKVQKVSAACVEDEEIFSMNGLSDRFNAKFYRQYTDIISWDFNFRDAASYFNCIESGLRMTCDKYISFIIHLEFGLVDRFASNHLINHPEDNPTDLTLQVDGYDIRVHKVILSGASNVFRSLLSDETEELIIEGTDYMTMKCLINYIYTNKFLDANVKEDELSIDDLILIFLAANSYDLWDLKEEITERFAKRLTLENVVQIFISSVSYEIKEIAEISLNYLKKHPEILSSDQFKSMDPKTVELISNILFL